MTIEFHNPIGIIKKKEIDFIRDKLIACHHAFDKISRAEVYCKEIKINSENNFACTINIDIFENSFYINKTSSSYEASIISVIEAIEKKVDEWIKESSSTLDDVLTTIKI